MPDGNGCRSTEGTKTHERGSNISIEQPGWRLFVRPRQRSRTALPPFSPHLSPSIEEVGIDRFELTVTGAWENDQPISGMTAQEVVAHLAHPPMGVEWFNNPARTRHGFKLATRSKPSCTLGAMELRFEEQGERRGRLSARLTGNVTRTLAHLLAEHGDGDDDFLNVISRLQPFQFFAQSSRSIPRAFGDTGDNWLADRDQMLRCLGPDPFDVFLPVYIGKLQMLVGAMSAPSLEAACSPDGSDLVVRDEDIVCRWHWGAVRVPQIECYFERHHSRAVGTVRAAATVALADLDQCDVRRYNNYTSDFIEREGDCLSIGTPLNDRYRLKVYAKARSCIRFEVQRHRKARNEGLDRPLAPEDHLRSIFRFERHHLLNAARWQNVAQLIDERETPQVSDLARLCAQIADACAVHDTPLGPVLTLLLEDGGSDLGEGGALSEHLLRHLARIGILRSHVVRRQSRRSAPRRYSLTPAYRNLVQIIRDALGRS